MRHAAYRHFLDWLGGLLSEEIGYTLGLVGPYASDEAGAGALQQLREAATTRRGDSVLLRERMAQSKSLSDVVRWAAGLWMHGSADGNSG